MAFDTTNGRLGDSAHDIVAKLDAFARQFSASTEPQESSPDPRQHQPLHVDNIGTAHDILTKPFSMSELKYALHRLQCGKACGEDGILNEALKRLGDGGHRTLLGILNMCMVGDTPEDWNVTRIQRLYKGKGKDKCSTSSSQPIAIRSCIYKLYAALL